MLKVSIKDLMEKDILSVRSSMALRRAGFTDLSKLENFTYEQIYLIRNCGHITTKEILDTIELIKTFNTIDDLLRHFEVKSLKEKAERLHKINEKVKSNKVTKLLTLALNKACSYGELKNCVTICSRILSVA